MAVTNKSPTDAHKPKVHKKSTTKRFHAYLLAGNALHTIEGVRKAKNYESDNSEMIKEQATFLTKGEMTEWINKRKLQHKVEDPELAEDPMATVEVKDNALLDVDDQAKVDAALREIDAKRPSDKLEVYWRTTRTSRAVSFVFRFRTLQGKEAWNMKPDALCLAFPNFCAVFKQEDPYVTQGLDNMQHARMRDLSGDMNAPEKKKWTSPITKEDKMFEIYLCTSYFVLPDLEELATAEMETAFIREKASLLGETILYVLKQETFAKCYERAIQHPRVWAAVSGETSKNPGNSYVDFAKGARVAVVHCPNFNTHVIKDDAAKLLQCLRKHDYKVEKYPEPEDEITDIEEDDTTDPKPETPNARILEPELDTP